ncbi:MAG: hypothetical protein LBR62_00130, partial [Puniceicoccales bacterium]|nr:hypothetical protein [Puniceicoccales bacterium]
MKSKVLRCLWFTVWGVYGGERNLWGTEMLPQVPFKTMTVPPSANMPSSSLEFVDGYSQKMTPVTGSREGKDHQFWPSSRVFHSAFGERLPETIKDFCSMQDIQVVLDEKVEIRQDKTNRVFRDMYPVDVWEQLTKTNGLLWFFDGSVLYVYQAAEMETKVFQVHPEQAESLLRLVDELGFYSSRLSLRAVKEAGLVIASGPPKFISLIEDMAKNMRFSKPVLAEDLCVRVFPLKHCWAMDRTIGSLTIPGMATILNSILGEAKQTAHLVPTIPIDSSLSHRAEAMKGVLRQKEEMQRKSSSPHKEKEEVFDELSLTSDRKDTLPRGGVIITDGRQNAIIVKDSKQNMPLYEEVIGKLDVPLELIEIKAAIVEINNSVGLSLGTDNTLTFGDAKVRAISINPLGVGGTEETESKNWSLKGIVNGGNFMAAIRYLESQNSAKLLARPSVITMDNMEAVMSRNETYYQSVSGSNK